MTNTKPLPLEELGYTDVRRIGSDKGGSNDGAHEWTSHTFLARKDGTWFEVVVTEHDDAHSNGGHWTERAESELTEAEYQRRLQSIPAT